MSTVRIVYNRSDCPYGCGTPLAPNLRWQGTPCQGCGRPLYPLRSVGTEDGRVLWPPAHIPRPPELGLPDVQVWYVVGEDDARDGVALGRAEVQKRVDKSEDGCWWVVLIVGLIIVLLVLAVVLNVVVAALRWMGGS